jgi:hypothetical protein
VGGLRTPCSIRLLAMAMTVSLADIYSMPKKSRDFLLDTRASCSGVPSAGFVQTVKPLGANSAWRR